MNCRQMFVSRLFSVNRKKNDFDRKYKLLGSPAENAPSPTISQIEQNLSFYFIYKHYEQLSSHTLSFGKRSKTQKLRM